MGVWRRTIWSNLDRFLEGLTVTGEICVGDFIVTSDKAGHGKKSTQPYPFGTVIGQAMESGCGDSFAIKAMIRKM